jgi:hypothetical protein
MSVRLQLPMQFIENLVVGMTQIKTM